MERVKRRSSVGPAHLRGVFIRFFSAVCVDLPQQVLDATIVELVTTVTVLIQLAHLAHEEVGDLKEKWKKKKEAALVMVNILKYCMYTT